MIQEMIQAFILIFIAEMGDKTQILAMAFATRYPVRKVLLGIGIGAFLNHGLAVALGSYLSRFVPISTLQMIAGAAFIGFALWTLKPEDAEDEEEAKVKFGPVATVALAFFLGELGDKTQLTAITLAADAKYPVMILAGTVTGMIGTGALGIIVGKKLGDKIPELGIKLLAASVFLFFGLQKLLQTVPERYLQMYFVIPVIGVLAIIVTWMVRSLLLRRKLGIQSDFIAKSKKLHDYYMHIERDLNHICLGEEHCKGCKGNQCAIGHAKEIIKTAMNNTLTEEVLCEDEKNYLDKPFVKEDVLDSLVDTIKLLATMDDERLLRNAHMIRNNLENILFGHAIEEYINLENYLAVIKSIDDEIAGKILTMVSE